MSRFKLRRRFFKAVTRFLAPETPDTTFEIKAEHEELKAEIEAEEELPTPDPTPAIEPKPAPVVEQEEAKQELSEEEILERRFGAMVKKARTFFDKQGNFIELDGAFRLRALVGEECCDKELHEKVLASKECTVMVQKYRAVIENFFRSAHKNVQDKVLLTLSNMQKAKKQRNAFEVINLVQLHIVEFSHSPTVQLAFIAHKECMRLLGWAEAQVAPNQRVTFTVFCHRDTTTWMDGVESLKKTQKKEWAKEAKRFLHDLIHEAFDSICYNFYGDPNPNNNRARDEKKQRYLRATTPKTRASNAMEIYDRMIRNSRHNVDGQLEELVDQFPDYVEAYEEIQAALVAPVSKKKRTPAKPALKLVPTEEEREAKRAEARKKQRAAKEAKLEKKINSKIKKIKDAIKSKKGLDMAEKRYKQLLNDHPNQFQLPWSEFLKQEQATLEAARKKAAAEAKASNNKKRNKQAS